MVKAYVWYLKFVLFCLLYTCFFSSVFGVSCNDPGLTLRQKDSCQLINLRTATNGDSWINQWDVNTPIDTWYGLTFTGSDDNLQVSRIELMNNNLTGTLPSDLSLVHLSWLLLGGNAITGTVPLFTGLPNLSALYLHNNDLSGTVPNFSKLYLEQIVLSNNPQITGTLPDFNNLPWLRVLRIEKTNLTGSLPLFEYNNDLEEIILYSNKLEGIIPDYDNPKLELLWLSDNDLSGSIPDFDLPKLRWMRINNNDLSGNIPNFSTPDLEIMDLSRNALSGSIPDFDMPELVDMNLSNNQLSGNIPDFDLPSLKSLALSYNQLNGSIPDFDLPNLTSLYLVSNQLTGTIPDFDLPLLYTMNLHQNKLTGTIPDFNLPSLHTLKVSNNDLKGPIPNFDLPKLVDLDMSGNEFRTPLTNFNNMPKLQELRITETYLCGELPAAMILPELRLLHIYENNFSGNIPETFIEGMPKLGSIIGFELGRVSGPIPDFVSESLSGLNLFSNYLTGPLPSFSGAPNLREIWLMDNLLSGPVPAYSDRLGSVPTTFSLHLYGNNFSFSDLSSGPYNDNEVDFEYNSQVIPLTYNAVNNTLLANAGFVTSPSENTYSWKKDCNGVITELNNNSAELTLPSVPDGCKYYCQISNSVLTQSDPDKILNTYSFVHGSLEESLCKYDAEPLECSGWSIDKIQHRIKYTGEESFLKGASYVEFSHPEELIQGGRFVPDPLSSLNPVNFGTSTNPGISKVIVPDMSALESAMEDNEVALGNAEFDVINDFDLSSQLTIGSVEWVNDCSGCEELIADFLYVYPEECGDYSYDENTRTVTIPFVYADYELNTVAPSVKFFFRDDIHTGDFVEVLSSNVVHSSGRFLVTFVLPPGAIDQYSFNYKVEGVSNSGRRFMRTSIFSLPSPLDLGSSMYLGSGEHTFNVVEKLRNPTCETYWNVRCNKYPSESYPVLLHINDILVFNGNLPYNENIYQPFTDLKGYFTIDELPSCYTLRSKITGSDINDMEMEMDYKVMCKRR